MCVCVSVICGISNNYVQYNKCKYNALIYTCTLKFFEQEDSAEWTCIPRKISTFHTIVRMRLYDQKLINYNMGREDVLCLTNIWNC